MASSNCGQDAGLRAAAEKEGPLAMAIKMASPMFFEKLSDFNKANSIDSETFKSHTAMALASGALWEFVTAEPDDNLEDADDEELQRWFVARVRQALWPVMNPKLVEFAKLLCEAWLQTSQHHTMGDDESPQVNIDEISAMNPKLMAVADIWPEHKHLVTFLRLRTRYVLGLLEVGVAALQGREGEWAKRLSHAIEALWKIAEECEDYVAAIDCKEHDMMEWQFRWCEMLGKASDAISMEKYHPKTEEDWRKEQALLKDKLGRLPRNALISHILALSHAAEAESSADLNQKSELELVAVLSDLYMSQKRKDDAALAHGWTRFIGEIRKKFANPLELTDTASLHAILAGTTESQEKSLLQERLLGEDAAHEPRIVASAITCEIFDKAHELESGCDSLVAEGWNGMLKLFVKPDASLSLSLRGSVVPVCRARAARTGIANAIGASQFYHVATSTWRGHAYDYFVVPGDNSIDLAAGSFIPGWAVTKTPKQKAPTMEAFDHKIITRISGGLDVEVKIKSLRFMCPPDAQGCSLIQLSRDPFPEEIRMTSEEESSADETERRVKKRRLMCRQVLDW